jgi:cytochrome c-type biogenesis protein
MDPAALTIPLVLLAGVVSFASPCFLPVVPVFAGYMAGATGGVSTLVLTKRRHLLAAAHAAVFMVAFGAVFAALWALVGLIGWAAADYRGVLRVAGGIVLAVLGLHVAGLIRIGLLDRVLKPAYSPDGAEPPSWRRSILLGLAFGAGWTPCIGPVLGGVLGLTTVATSAAAGLGLLAVYTLGLGLPFILVSAGLTSLTARLRWFQRHHRGVNLVTGLVLVVIGFLMISNLFARLAGLAAFHL